jgi:hypothetical protein
MVDRPADLPDYTAPPVTEVVLGVQFNTLVAVVDNYANPKHSKVKPWLARHPRWTFCFTPTSGS